MKISDFLKKKCYKDIIYKISENGKVKVLKIVKK